MGDKSNGADAGVSIELAILPVRLALLALRCPLRPESDRDRAALQYVATGHQRSRALQKIGFDDRIESR
jgi:hypothetical protein